MFDKLQKTMGEVLEFPPDVLEDVPKITLTGRRQVVVENYKEILAFSGEEITLSTAEGKLVFKGKTLVLKSVLPTELLIEGEIISLTYEDNGTEGRKKGGE